jgi:hypothetical protein
VRVVMLKPSCMPACRLPAMSPGVIKLPGMSSYGEWWTVACALGNSILEVNHSCTLSFEYANNVSYLQTYCPLINNTDAGSAAACARASALAQAQASRPAAPPGGQHAACSWELVPAMQHVALPRARKGRSHSIVWMWFTPRL